MEKKNEQEIGNMSVSASVIIPIQTLKSGHMICSPLQCPFTSDISSCVRSGGVKLGMGKQINVAHLNVAQPKSPDGKAPKHTLCCFF